MLAVLGLSVVLILKEWKADLLPLVRIALVLAFCFALLRLASPAILYIKSISQSEGLAEYSTLLFKALGIAALTHICAQMCRESGESGIASGVELVGKTEILLLCIPLIEELLTLAQELLRMGGAE
jgi:stage III sporulation protein AD